MSLYLTRQKNHNQNCKVSLQSGIRRIRWVFAEKETHSSKQQQLTQEVKPEKSTPLPQPAQYNL